MNFSTDLTVSGELEALHIRGGRVIDRRWSPPREPLFVRQAKAGFFGENLAKLLRHLGIRNEYAGVNRRGLVTTAGVNYMASAFNAGGAISAFSYHDCGTGKLQGATNNLASPYASNATPIVITETAHGRISNDLVTIASVTTNTNANGDWQILVLTSNTYSLYGSVGNGVAAGSPTAQRINGAADTALTTAAGTARVSGTPTNPTANQYKSVAVISFTSSLSILEWGLFSASSSGTLWDRRYLNNLQAPQVQATGALTAAPISVQNGDSIQWSYTTTISAGGT